MAAYGTVSVGTAPVLILPANQNRKSYLICNTSTSVKLYIGPDAVIATTTGIEVQTGGNITEDFSGLKTLYTGPIYGVAASTIDVRFWERV